MIELVDVDKKLKSVFQEVFNTPPEMIHTNTKQNELQGWDSLGQLRIIMAVEESFNISFMIDEIPQLNSYGKMLDAVVSKSGI